MTRLEVAMQRFSMALEKLAAAAAHAESARTAAMPSVDIAALRAERDELLARITVLEDESRELSGVTEEVEQRLDGAIAEIRSVLERS